MNKEQEAQLKYLMMSNIKINREEYDLLKEHLGNEK